MMRSLKLSDTLCSTLPTSGMSKHLLSFNRRTSFLVAVLFALSGTATLQQSLVEHPDALPALIIRTSRTSPISLPALSRRRRSTGATLVKPTPSSVPTAIKAGCGDGLLTGKEACDDKNALSGDGCSGSCAPETGFECSGQPSKCWSLCGDGVVASTERCDDGDLDNGDGCSSACKDEFGYKCSGSPSVCKIPAYCGNAIVETGETCDDGNSRQYDGCFNCKTE